MGISAAILGGALLANTAVQQDQARKANNAQKEAQQATLAEAKKNADLQDQATNKANAKTPDIAALLKQNTGGPGSTMLTGSGGIDPSSLMLGRSTLLGA